MDGKKILIDAAEYDDYCALKEKYHWHDLRKNPEDLPEYEEEVLIRISYRNEEYTSVGARYTDVWTSDFLPALKDDLAYDNVIAWMPIPEFKEET